MSAVTLRPYAEMRPSGTAWLGKIPRHWRMVRAKRLFDRMKRPIRFDDETVTCFRDGVVTLRKNRRVLGFTESLKEIGYQGVRRGDLVIHAMDAFAGACGVADADGKCTPVYLVCAPQDRTANCRYYAFCVREMARSQWILALSRGVRERSTDFRYSTFASQFVPVPPSHEQTAIVRFLDAADRCIQSYIRTKERLIELLEEQRQAITHQTVTGQIDVRTGQPYQAYKDAGVKRLGKVPESWEVRRIATIADLRVSNVDKHVREEEEPIRLCNYVDVYHNDRIRGDIAFMPATARKAQIQRFRMVIGDVLLTKDSEDWTDIGVPALVDYAAADLVCGYHLGMLRPDDTLVHPGYLFRALSDSGVTRQFRVAANGVTRYGLSRHAIRSVRIPLPPVVEQHAIVGFLDHADRMIQRHVSAARRQIALLQEYSTRLTADVVTGKLDVRAAAAQLPNEYKSLRSGCSAAPAAPCDGQARAAI